ncbi:MAG: SH3 domain-containing protein [Defluviitaleaceae bacterium]|nr:SH3 domain-containing protein [Defluviitaleaceae bacterium]MCL2261951.1 SH3 domain-containing protein [Defluviitaleaceae bacterium]
MRKIFLLLVAVLAIIFATMPVFATTGFHSMVIPYYVNGLRFDVYGYRGDSTVALPALRLMDIAYMLNGTISQFDIVAPPENGIWDVWIKRGAPYTITGEEMRPILPRAATFGSYGLLSEAHGTRGFVGNPYPIVTLGFDGEAYPAFTLSLRAVRDIDGYYFSVYELSYWLDFYLVDFDGWDNWNETLEIITTPSNAQLPNHHITRNTFPIGSRQTIVFAYALHVRTGPSNNYDTLTFVRRGETFEILDYHGRFVQIETPRGTGWIFAGFLSRR